MAGTDGIKEFSIDLDGEEFKQYTQEASEIREKLDSINVGVTMESNNLSQNEGQFAKVQHSCSQQSSELGSTTQTMGLN